MNDEEVTPNSVRTAIIEHHYADMRKKMSKYKKLDQIKYEDFRKDHNYFNVKSVEHGRLAFKIRSRMLENIPKNFKSKFMKIGEDALICPQNCRLRSCIALLLA